MSNIIPRCLWVDDDLTKFWLKHNGGWSIVFLGLLMLRLTMMGLLVYNFLKFISPSVYRLWFVFFALLFIWIRMFSLASF